MLIPEIWSLTVSAFQFQCIVTSNTEKVPELQNCQGDHLLINKTDEKYNFTGSGNNALVNQNKFKSESMLTQHEYIRQKKEID